MIIETIEIDFFIFFISILPMLLITRHFHRTWTTKTMNAWKRKKSSRNDLFARDAWKMDEIWDIAEAGRFKWFTQRCFSRNQRSRQRYHTRPIIAAIARDNHCCQRAPRWLLSPSTMTTPSRVLSIPPCTLRYKTAFEETACNRGESRLSEFPPRQMRQTLDRRAMLTIFGWDERDVPLFFTFFFFLFFFSTMILSTHRGKWAVHALNWAAIAVPFCVYGKWKVIRILLTHLAKGSVYLLLFSRNIYIYIYCCDWNLSID